MAATDSAIVSLTSGNVQVIYTTATAQSIPNSTSTPILFNTLVKDTHSAFNTTTGVFTVPTGQAGTYFIAGQIQINWPGSASIDAELAIMKGGVFQEDIARNSSAVSLLCLSGATLIPLAAGDTITLNGFHGVGTTRTLNAAATANRIAIFRVGP
jgi:hypothetical protein